MKTLYDTFMNAYHTSIVDPWRIYEKSTGKLLCKDYGSLKADDESIDDRLFFKAEKKKLKSGLVYWRIVVY